MVWLLRLTYHALMDGMGGGWHATQQGTLGCCAAACHDRLQQVNGWYMSIRKHRTKHGNISSDSGPVMPTASNRTKVLWAHNLNLVKITIATYNNSHEDMWCVITNNRYVIYFLKLDTTSGKWEINIQHIPLYLWYDRSFIFGIASLAPGRSSYWSSTSEINLKNTHKLFYEQTIGEPSKQRLHFIVHKITFRFTCLCWNNTC